ncbi:TIGR02391 family protein [Lactobacillus acetotolerans]|uniref:TIGR02391 family protein n=1 Tax=Lactobacillus acetotolerans TaxID=1600 RepID=UPI00241E753D|nr:TIGR02391 family protein [Lactobacillus acetotolerans]
MNIEKLVSKDVWGVISDNYEKGSYTIAITNLIQYANEIVREKSGLDFDNTKLMDIAFLGNNPQLKITKFQTQTEKDIQAGIGYLLKGLCLAIRNPRAHKRYNDKKETADTIILFVDYVLQFVRDSKQPALIEDWLEFVFDDNFNNTKEYAAIVLQEIPEKKRYELLVSIFRYRERAKPGLLNNLVSNLMDSIDTKELEEFLENLNKELLYCSDDDKLRMFLSLFPPEKWTCLIPLTKLRIEHMVEKSLEQAIMYRHYDEFDAAPDYICNDQGELSTWAVNFISHFDAKDNIFRLIGNKLANRDANVRNFIIKYYKDIIFGEVLLRNIWLQYGIKKSLLYFDKEVYDNIEFQCNILENKEIEQAFKKEIEIAFQHFYDLELKSDIPF